MKKYKFYLAVAVFVILSTAVLLYIKATECTCHKYKTFKVVTLQGMQPSARKDSICVLSSVKATGEISMKVFEDGKN